MKSLEHSDELYRAIVETAGEGIWVVDANDRTTFVNPQLAELLGYECDEILGQLPSAFIDQEWVEPVGAELERLRQGVRVRAEFPFRRKDGTLVETFLSCRPVHDADGRYGGAVALVTDVTEQRRAQHELEASELRFRTLVERLPGATYIKDIDRNFTYVSPQASKLFGIPHDEWDGGGSDLWRDLVHPDDRDAVLEGVERSQADGTPFSQTFRLVTPERGTVWVQDETYPITDVSGNFLHWQGLILDVTARMETEEALRSSERMFRTMFDNEPECVKLIARDGSLLEMNGAGLEMVEADSFDELRGRQITEIVAPEHRKAFSDLHRGVLLGERRNLEFDIVGLRGTRRSLETTAAPLRDDAGAIIGHLGVTRDVTSRRKLEADLRRAQRMEGLGRIAGGVAHDFNNILTAIIGYGESITRRGREEAEDAREILRAADRAAELVQQLLVFSSRQPLEPKVLDLNDVVRDVERMLARTLGEHIDVICELSDDLRTVEGDAGQLQQVILNLALNARDAMPSGGVLTLETANVVFDHDGALPAGGYAQLTVTDIGSGMAESVREHVFDPFFTTKPPGEGTGLGLATVYGIVNQSGGHIVVYSEPELGTSFKVYLPASSQVAPDGSSDAQELPQAPATGTVLLVEDEIVVRHLVREILERDGYTVLEAETPEQALATSDDPHEIDLLLTDVVMPRMSGPEIARALSAGRDEMKVLYMSGYSDAAVVQRGLLEPGTAFIQKPFRARELTDKVRALLARG